MPATNTTNLVIPEIMRTELNVEFVKLFNFVLAGAAEYDPNVPAGEFINIRGFNELTGDEDRMVDGGSYNTNSIDTHKDIGVILHRIKKFGAEDLGQIISGMDATGAIKRMILQFFMKATMNNFLRVLEAIFHVTGGALRSTNVLNKYVDNATTGRGFLTPANGVDTMAKLGDNMFDLGVWFMHSATYAYLLGNKFLESSTNLDAYGIDNQGNVTTFLKKPIVVCDFGTKIAGTSASRFRTYMLGRGALYHGVQKNLNPEQSRDSNKVDIISTDYHYCVHLRGVKWKSTTPNPTAAQLATATNWELAYTSAKMVRAVALDHNNAE